MSTKKQKNHITQGDSTDELDISILDDPEICPECRTRTIILDEEKCVLNILLKNIRFKQKIKRVSFNKSISFDL